MAVDLSQLGELLKTVYVGPLNKAIGDRVLLWNDLNSIGMKRVKIVGETIYCSRVLRVLAIGGLMSSSLSVTPMLSGKLIQR